MLSGNQDMIIIKDLFASLATKKTTLNIITALIIINVADYANAVDINGFTLSGDERAGWVSYD